MKRLQWDDLLIFGAFIVLLLEGLFHPYLEMVIVSQSSLWTRITPYLLYPSELIGYGGFFAIGFPYFLSRLGRFKSGLGTIALVLFWIVGLFSAINGIYRGNPTWFTDFRQLFLMSVFATITASWGITGNIVAVKKLFLNIAIVAAIFNGIKGLLVLGGQIDRESVFAPHYTGEIILVFAYVLALSTYFLTEDRRVWPFWALTFGILTPLNKPALGFFFFANITTLTILSFLSDKIKRLFKFAFLTTISLVLGCLLLDFVSEGAAIELLSRRFLKTNVETDRDLSSGRLDFWRWAVDRWIESPFFGTGLGENPTQVTSGGDDHTVPIHNMPLTVLYQTGIFGFIGCVIGAALWLTPIKWILKSKSILPHHKAILVASVAYACALVILSFYGHNLGVPGIGMVFWATLGLSSALCRRAIVVKYSGLSSKI